MRQTILATLLFCLCWLSPALATEKLYIGAGLPLSGKNQAEGQAMANALQLSLQAVNRQGGIHGRQVELVLKDDKNDKAEAQKVARAFAADPRILAVIGHQFSSVALAAGEAYDKGQLVHISPSASNPQVTRQSKWVFSMNYQDEMQGESLAVYLNLVLGARRVAVIHSDDAYGTGLKDSFSRKAQRVGLTLSQVIPYSEEKKFGADFIARHWQKQAVDAIVIFAHTDEGAKLVQQLRQQRIPAPVIGPDAFAKTSFIEALAGQTDNVLVAGPFLYELASLKTKQFVDAYKQAYQADPTIWAAFCYDALSLVLEGLKEQKQTRAQLRQFMADINAPARARQGITGKLFFDEKGAMDRQIMVSMIDEKGFKPAFTQIKMVTEPHILNNLEPKVADGEVALVDRIPYYLTKVVYTGLDVTRINSINVIKQSFDIEFFMWFRWTGQVDVNNIDFVNGIFGVDDKKEVLRKGRHRSLKYVAYKIKSSFLTPYDLRLFPFDTQALPLIMSHKSKDANQLMLVVDHKNLSQAYLQAIYPEEWTFQRREDFSGTFAEHSTFGDPSYAGGDSKVDFSIYQTHIVIKRILFPYVVKIFMPLTILIIMSMCVFLIPISQFDARLTLVMTALLSVLVFHMSQDDALPSVGYMIKADQFFVIAYVLQFSLVSMTIAVNLLTKKDKQALADQITRFFLVSSLTGVPMSFVYLLWTAFF